MRAVFPNILGFVIVIDLFYMSIGQWWLSQTEEHPPAKLEITAETDNDTLVSMGRTLLGARGGCLLCHKISEQGNTRGPDLRGVGARAASRRPGMTAEAYLFESLDNPGAYVVEGFETASGESIMPVATRPPADLSPTELKAVIAFLQSMGGEITVDITEADVAAAAARQAQPKAVADVRPGADLPVKHGCIACHDVKGTLRLVGPPLTNVRERLSAAEIRQSIMDPDAVVAEGFPPGLMLKTFAETIPPEELDQLVSYLSGEVPLSERLSHPGLHLAALILVFNGGVWIIRRLAIRRALASGESNA